MNEAHEPAQEFTKIHARRASLSVNAILHPLLWGLVQQIHVFCEHILARLGKFGVRPEDLRVDNGDGSVGGFNLAFWALDSQVRCTIRLPRAEVICHAMEAVDVEMLDEVIQTIFEAIERIDQSIVVQRYEVVFQVHGTTPQTSPRTFLQQFVKHEPKGLGPCVGNAVSFTFGPAGTRLSCSITADLSREFVDSIFIEGRVSCDGTQVTRKELKSETANYVKESLAALELILPVSGVTE